jgi:hypothetical protein
MILVMAHISVALWVAFDGFSRRMGLAPIPWSLGALVLWPLVLPVYLARRFLKNGEVRRGGTAWNVLRNFAVAWTFLAASTLITFLGAIINDRTLRIGINRALFDLVMLWILPAMGAVLIGLFLRDETVIEEA